MIIHDDSGNTLTELPLLEGKRVLPVKINSGLNIGQYDYVEVFYPNDGVTERYTFKTGGASGTTVATIILVYTDTTKEKIVTVTKI